MSKKSRIVIFGDGRIGRAVKYFLSRSPHSGSVKFLKDKSDVQQSEVLIGAVPSEIGQQCLMLALRNKKHLIDISDIDPPFYLKKKKEIKIAGITVIPECGFSPGLVNLILGYELKYTSDIRDIEVAAGSLSSKPGVFPFLWCFEDLVLEHQMKSLQLIKGRVKKVEPFAGLRKEKIFGIDAESYFCASGFEQLMKARGLHDFHCRVVRPEGFEPFFKGLERNGFLNKKNFNNTKSTLESSAGDNITFARIRFTTKTTKRQWVVKSSSRKTETLNSMQKITAAVPALMCEWIIQNKVQLNGLHFMEELADDKNLAVAFMKGLKKYGVEINKTVLRIHKR